MSVSELQLGEAALEADLWSTVPQDDWKFCFLVAVR
jgi:hypothetical protein